MPRIEGVRAVTTSPLPEDDPGLIERLDAGEPPGSPEEAQARAPYERLFQRIRDLDDIAPSNGWEDRAVARWSTARSRRRVGIALGLTAAMGLAAAALLQPCAARTSEPGLQVAVSAARGAPRRGDHVVGDVLHARARIERAHVDLRIYLDTRLVARCPGTEQCRRDASIVELDWKLVEPGTYRVVVFSSSSDIPPPVDGTVDQDLLEARNAGASSATETITVGL
jgi:hypothetical protein